jgi:hypothetical protein
MADSAAHAERAISLLKCRQVGHWPNNAQWPPRERERLAPRLLAVAFRFVGRTGRGKNVPSGNSKYRLNTCT